LDSVPPRPPCDPGRTPLAHRRRELTGERGLERIAELTRGGEPIRGLLGKANREHEIDLGR
jgi:hypothetical protein